MREGELARVRSRWGSMVARVRTGGDMPRGTVFVPIHWNAQFASDARVGALVNPVVDPDLGRAGVQAHAGRRSSSSRSTGTA